MGRMAASNERRKPRAFSSLVWEPWHSFQGGSCFCVLQSSLLSGTRQGSAASPDLPAAIQLKPGTLPPRPVSRSSIRTNSSKAPEEKPATGHVWIVFPNRAPFLISCLSWACIGRFVLHLHGRYQRPSSPAQVAQISNAQRMKPLCLQQKRCQHSRPLLQGLSWITHWRFPMAGVLDAGCQVLVGPPEDLW